MASNILRRSVNAVIQYCQMVEFKPEFVIIAGTGVRCEEAVAMREEWGNEFSLFGFEPNPNSFKSVFETFPGILYEKAISDYNGTGILKYPPRHKDGSTLFDRKEDQPANKLIKTEVKIEKLDDALNHLLPSVFPFKGKRGLLWLDCEGSELQAIHGGKKIIEKYVGMINVEMTGNPRCEGWSDLREVHAILKELGFERVWAHTIRASICQYDAIYVHSDIAHPRYRIW